MWQRFERCLSQLWAIDGKKTNMEKERIPGNDVSLKHLKHDSICIQQTTVNILYRGAGLTLPTKKNNRESRKNRDLTASN